MLLGIDLGTSSVKVAVMTDDGSVKQSASAGYAIDAPRLGWAETDPGAWWLATRMAVTSLDVEHLSAVDAIGLSGQMHGVVLTREDGGAARAAVLWADGRSAEELDRYRRLDARLLDRLANPPATGMAGPTLRWLKTHESAVYESARWALQPKDWLRMQLTREALTEPTDASATLLYDLEADTWSPEVLHALDIRPGLLPTIVASYDRAGLLREEPARELHLRTGIPVAAGAADAAALLAGHGMLEPGAVLLTVGTGAQITTVRNELRPDPAKYTLVYRTIEKHKWYAMAAILNAGLALDWVRDLFHAEWRELYQSVVDVAPGADGVTFLPYLVRERTSRHAANDSASWSGIELRHGREHLFRAALEGVAFLLREAMEALEATGVAIPELLLDGGGTLHEPWRQMLSDVLGKPLLAAASPAGAVRGAALLAGVAAGTYKSPGDLAAMAPGHQPVAEPGAQSDTYSDLYRKWLPLSRGAGAINKSHP
jgi:xylulokinase